MATKYVVGSCRRHTSLYWTLFYLQKMYRPGSRDRLVIRVSAQDQPYQERVRDILLAEPCRGVPVEPAQLISHVYIGSQANAESLRLLRRLGVTHVLNCAGFKGPRKQPEVSPYEGLGIDYHEFKAEDVDTYDIVQHFREAFSFIDRAHRRGGVVLVHCAMGINRSGATCVAYLMHHRNWCLLKTIQLIKDRRRIVLSNKGFQLQLIRYARSIGMLDKLDSTTSKPRESRQRTLPPRSRRDHSDLPPSSYARELPPRSRKQRSSILSNSYNISENNRDPIHTNLTDYRRNSNDFRRLRNGGNLDLLSMCVQDTLSLGRRSNSVDRNRNSRYWSLFNTVHIIYDITCIQLLNVWHVRLYLRYVESVSYCGI